MNWHFVSGKVRPLEAFLIAFILLTVGLCLFPTFVDRGEHPRATQCLSNLKQIALFCLIYAADYDERLMHRDRWMDQTAEYRKNEDVLHCPTVWERTEKAANKYGYAFNGSLSQVDSSNYKSPQNVVMLYDSISLWRNASDLLQSLPEPPRVHGKGNSNTVAFLDGHVKSFRTNRAIFDIQKTSQPRMVAKD